MNGTEYLNLSNVTDKFLQIPVMPFVDIFGNMFFAMVLLVIAGGIYLGTDKNTFIVSLYLFATAMVFVTILYMLVTALILFITGLIFTVITYNAFIEKKVR